MRVIIKASLTFIGFSHTVVALGAPLASTTVGLHHCMSDEQDHPMARMIGRTQCLFSQILSLIQIPVKSINTSCLGTLWQYGLWSFQTGDKKLERFLPKNQHT